MEGKTKKDWRFWVFLVLSILWSIRVFWLLIEDQYFSGFSGSMPLNEVGDFLAGSFSPLAFAWLAYGYWMQNRELKSSVEQTSEAQRIARDQLEFQKSIRKEEHLINHNKNQPQFEFTSINDNKFPVVFVEFINKGHQVTKFMANCKNTNELISIPIIYESISHDQTVKAKLNLHFTEYKEEPVATGKVFIYEYHISYLDGLKQHQSTSFSLNVFDNKKDIKPNARFKHTYVTDH